MRELKFRAWDKTDKEMVLNPDVNTNGQKSFNNLIYSIQKRFVFMQYTGLKDKNGKEIYEGDILNSGDGVNREVISLEFVFHLVGENVWYGEESEIIGNIYENPELI